MKILLVSDSHGYDDELKMKQILLVCSAGMSTSLLVTKMEGAAKDAGYDAKIFALPFSDAPSILVTNKLVDIPAEQTNKICFIFNTPSHL